MKIWRLISITFLFASMLFACAFPWRQRSGLDKLDSAMERWSQAGLTDNLLVYSLSCFCPQTEVVITVEDSQVAAVVVYEGLDQPDPVSVPEDEFAEYRTVPDFFDLIVELDKSVDTLSVAFDQVYGYPTLIDVDPRGERCVLGCCSIVFDDEYSYHLRLEPS